MRAGVFISVISHIAFVALALLGTPKLFEGASPGAIEVDLVRPDEIEAPKEKPPEDKTAAWTPLPEKTEPWPESAPPAKTQPPPDASQQAALVPRAPPPAPAQPSIFDPINIPALLDLPNAPEKGFDSESTTTANLSNEEKAAFKVHLKKCWKLPDNMSPAQSTRVVLRVYLRRDGRLAGEPVLIEASASRDGPVLLQAALRTLKDCQPYGFLPADRYREWRVLDLRFSPRDMAGG